jgi:diacylglycerol O-acyltransferase
MGGAALLTKMSHAVTDGVGGMQLNEQIYDAERDPPPRPMPLSPTPEDLSPAELTFQAFRRLPVSTLSTTFRGVGGLVRVAFRTARAPAQTVPSGVAYVQSLRRVLTGETVEPSPLLRRRSLASRVEVHEVPMDDLRRAGKAADGCSVNDAYVAAVCGAMRLYHEALGAPVETLPIAVPISIRTSADPRGGNRIGSARFNAPVGKKDPIERMRIIHQEMVVARAEPALTAMRVVAPVVSRVPTPMLTVTSRAFENIDLQVSNIPGETNPRFIAGARTERLYAAGPLLGVPLMVVLISLAGTACIGVRYDRAAVSEFDLFARCLREGFDEVVASGADVQPGR